MSMRFVSLLLVLCVFAVPAWGQPASTLTLLDEGGQEGSDFTIGERLTLRLESAELNTPDLDVATALVTASDGDSQEVALAETAPDSGVFQGSLPLRTGSPLIGNGKLETSSGATITATHEDLGGATESTATATVAPHKIQFLDRRGAVTEKVLEGYKVLLRVYDWNANTDNTYPDSVLVTVTAQGTTDLESKLLIETGADSGVFEGWVYTEVTDGSHGLDDDSLETFAAYPNQHDTVVANYAPGATTPSTATAPTVGAILRVLDEWGNEAAVFSPGQRIYFQLEQVRRWMPPYPNGLRLGYVNVRSTTTLDLESVPVIETGIESWVYEGSVLISTDPSASGFLDGVVHATADGEGLEILVNHPSNVTHEIVTVTNDLTSVRFLDEDGRPATRLFENQWATVRVQDMNPVSSVLVALESLLGGDTQSLTSLPVPGSLGAYDAPFFVRFGPPVAAPRLLVSRLTGNPDGADTVTASYSGSAAASATARTLASSLAVLDDDGAETDSLPITAPLRLRVRDHSAASPVVVTVTSWETGDTEEVSLAAIEPGSAIFEGEIPTGFGNAYSPDGRLQTRIGDVVTVVHGWDPDPAFHATTSVHMTATALDFVDAEGKATDFYLRNARVYLRLRDSRFNGSPFQVDTAGVVVRSINWDGQRLDQETVMLTETAPDSSLFTGSIRMEGDFPYDQNNGVLQTSYNQYPYAEYDTLSVEGYDTVDQARTVDSILRITDAQGNDLPSAILGQTVYVRLERPLYNSNPNAVDIAFNVRLKSNVTGDVERINLYETGLNTGVFAGSIFTYQGSQNSLTGSLSGQPGEYFEVWSDEITPLSADVAWFVAASGNAPTPVNDTATTLEDGAITIDVLANDTDPDGDPLTVTGISGVTNGTAVINPDSTVTFTPIPNTNNTGSFSYQVSDGAAVASATVTITVTPVNDPPNANNDTYTVNEDTASTLNVRFNDSDPDPGSTLTITHVTNPTWGTTTTNGSTITYTPQLNYSGSDSFVYTLSDGVAVDTATVSITVFALNDPPTAVPDFITVNEDSFISFTPTLNDTDPEGHIITLLSYTSPPVGTGFYSRSSNTLTYTPAANYNGSFTTTYVARDINGASSSPGTITITVNPVADSPDAVNDSITTPEDTPVTISVLANDTDPDGNPLTITTTSQGTKGAVAILGTTVRYTPNLNATGSDSFTYTINDGTGRSDTATVSVTITAVNDAPNAVDDAVSTNESTAIAITVLANDTDAENQTLTVTLTTPPTNGAAVVGADKRITYTPNFSFSGTDSFTYTVSDGTLTDTATVTITVINVNDPPYAVDDQLTTAEDTPGTVAVLANDSDNEGQPLTVTSYLPATHGFVVINPDSTITYTPKPNFSGEDFIVYTVSDGQDTNTALVLVTVTAVNDPPVAADDTAATNEETAVTITVRANDTDVEGNTLTVTQIAQGTKGTAVINANGTVTYTPNANANGTDTFEYTLSDGNGTDTATVTVTIYPVPDDPVAVDDTATTPEDTPVTINVLANDTDADGDTLTVAHAHVVGNPIRPILVNGDGTIPYTPPANFSGTEIIRYTMGDGTSRWDDGEVTVTVTPVNDAPDAVNDSASTNEDAAVTIAVRANDTDVENDPLSITAVTQGSNGSVTINPDGTVTYTPNANFHGADAFTYTVSDGNGGSDSAAVSVTITSVNDGPDAVDDTASTDEDTAVTVSVLGNDTDLDGDSLSISAVTQGTNGTVAISGANVIYTPNANFHGADSFTYTASDGNGGSDTATVTVTVNPVNDAPDAVNDSASTNEDAAVTVSVLGNDTDLDDDSLSISAVTQGTNGAVTISGSNVIYTPNADFHGADSFTYTVSDGNGGSDTATVNVTVTSINDAPDAVNDSASTNEDVAVTVSALTNDSDLDGDSLSISAVTQGSDGTVTISGANVIYTPNANFHGADSFTYTVSDGNGGSDTATVTVNVSGTNDAPDAGNDSTSTNEDVAVTVPVLGNDSDLDGDSIAISSVTQGGNGSVTISGSNVIYTPNANFHGADSFTYTISDGNGGNDTATVSVTINAVNDAPDAVNDSASTDEDSAVTVPVLGNDSDLDGDSIEISAVTQGGNGSVAISGANVIYTPNANFNGADSFTYTISDGNGGNDTATVSVTIASTNDAPTANADSASTSEDTAVTVSVLNNDTDLDGGTLSVSSVTQGGNGGVTISGLNVIYTPNANFHGTDAFTYTVSDGQGGSATASVSVSVSAVNDPPSAVNDAAATNEDTAVIITVLANDSDVDGDALQVTAVTQGTKGSVAANGDGTLTYTPAPNTNGVDSFTYTVRDAASVTRTATVTVSVAPINDAPVATADTANTREDASVVISVKANDTDLESNPLTVTGTSTPANGTAAVNGDGTVTYTADANFTGTDSFTYTLSDGQGGTADGTVTVTVTDAFERVAVLGTHGVWVQTGADVLSGDVVVNQTGTSPFLTGSVELSLAGTVTTPAGWDVQANRVDVASGATVASHLFYNQKTGTGSVTGPQTTPLPLPVFASLPTFQTGTPGATDVIVGTNGTRTLAAGSYRDLIVGRKGTVTFTGGTYNFRTVQIDREAKIYFSAATNIRVQQKLSTLQTTVLQPAAGATIDGSDVVIYVAGINGTTGTLTTTPKSVEFGTDNVVWANIYAPNGTIWVKDRTAVRGSLVGKDVQVGPNAQVTLDSYYVGQ